MPEDLRFHIIPKTGHELDAALSIYENIYDINSNVDKININKGHRNVVWEVLDFKDISIEEVKRMIRKEMRDDYELNSHGGKLTDFYFYGKLYEGGTWYQINGSINLVVAIKDIIQEISWNRLEPVLAPGFDYSSQNYLAYTAFFLNCCGCKFEQGFDYMELISPELSTERLSLVKHAFSELDSCISPIATTSVFHSNFRDYILDFILISKSFKDGLKLGLAYTNSDNLIAHIHDSIYQDVKSSYPFRRYRYDQIFAQNEADIKEWTQKLDLDKCVELYQRLSYGQVKAAIHESVNKVPNMKYFEINKSEIACVHDPTLNLGMFYYHLWKILNMA